MNGNLEFIKEVSAYFMDFLQSNFKSNKLPKRHIRLKNEKNMKIGVNITSKYDRFDGLVKNLVTQNLQEDATIIIKRGTHTQKPNKETTKLFEKLTANISIDKVKKLNITTFMIQILLFPIKKF